MLERVRASHPLVAAAEGRVVEARGARSAAGALPNPVLTYQSENGPWPGSSQAAGFERETAIFATLPLESFFQRWPRVRRANADIRAAEATLVATRRQTVLDAAHAFYRVALAQASVQSAREIEAALRALVTYNESRAREGVAAEGELLRVQVELARAATTLALEEAELGRARALLDAYIETGAGPDSTLASRPVMVEDSVAAAADLPPLEWFVEHARGQRAELVAARARAAAARAEVGLQQTLIFRQLGVILGNKRVGNENTLLAGVTAPIPLFDQNRGGRLRAAGERTAAEQELAWMERTAVAEVEAAWRATQTLGRQIARMRGTFLPRAEEGQRITLAAYEEGAATLLQVLDASRALADARATWYRALFAQREGLLELTVVAGFEPGDTIPTPTDSPDGDTR